MTPTNCDTLFRKAILASIFIHLLFWSGFLFKGARQTLDSNSKTMEIDLTRPFRIGGNPLLKAGGGTNLEIPKEKIGPLTPAETISDKKSLTPKEWLLPESKETPIEKPQPSTGPKSEEILNTNVGGTGEGLPGSGGGWGGGEGEGGGIALSRFPKLLNRSEILKLLRRLYPTAERQAGHEGVVIVDLHLSIDGTVSALEIAETAGASFDEVAKEVSKKMKFSPAYVGENPVAVKIRQSIVFHLEE